MRLAVRQHWRIASVWLYVLSVSAIPFSLAAQEANFEASAENSGADVKLSAAVCMSGVSQSLSADESRLQTYRLRIVVAESDVPSFEERGFAIIPCAAVSVPTGTNSVVRGSVGVSYSAWRDQACSLAAYGNAAVQIQFADILGVAPSELCSSAERVAGAWTGNKIDLEREQVVERLD